jgi:outer membrane protein assembly factor BamB
VKSVPGSYGCLRFAAAFRAHCPEPCQRRDRLAQDRPCTEIEKVHQISSPATSTPATDRARVFVYFGSYGVLAYEWDGATAWEYPMGVAKFNVPDGSGTSPILAGGMVIVTRDGPPHSLMLALRASDGKPAWNTKLEVTKQPGPKIAHATPVVYPAADHARDQIILNRSGFVSGFAVSDGHLLWTLPTSSIGISTCEIAT